MRVKSDTGLFIHSPGPLSLMQCDGRKHLQHFGLSEGGACDGFAYRWANYLLDNPQGCATIEVTMGPFEAEFIGETMIALCGAEFQFTLNSKRVDNWSTHRVVSGDRIKMLPKNNGVRSYLAVKNGFLTAQHFGYYTEVPKETFSPRIVTQGALLDYRSYSLKSWIHKSVPQRFVPNYKTDLLLRVIPSYQYAFFLNKSLQALTENGYEVSQRCDRMGYRLQGESICWAGADILSEGIAYGSVQIPPDGQPIVLLNDRQTVGGYPKIGCVIKEDCYQLAQRQAGQKVGFSFLK